MYILSFLKRTRPHKGGSVGRSVQVEGDPTMDTKDISIFGAVRPAAVLSATKDYHKDTNSMHDRVTEAASLLRKQHHIHVSGQSPPPPVTSFQELLSRYECPAPLVAALAVQGIHHPTPIQMQAIPAMMLGLECFACAPTGSGKTIAYLLPILSSLLTTAQSSPAASARALVLAPTRELAMQIGRVATRLEQDTRHAAEKHHGTAEAGVAPKNNVGRTKLRIRVMTKATAASCSATPATASDDGASNEGSISLENAPCIDLLISTPLRLNAMLQQGRMNLSGVRHLVFDESDKLFELGFVEQIDAVLAACTHPSLLRCLFSATLPETVEQLARSVMHQPLRIVIGERNSASSAVEQRLVFVGSEEGKLLALRQIIKEGVPPPVLIFVQSKERAKQLHREMAMESLKVDSIHADRTQAQREEVVERFRLGLVWFLIATDVMARGMDFKGINYIINYDCPHDNSVYIHRIGRSGRAGRPGKAITLYTEEDAPALRSLANVMTTAGMDVPSWMLSMPKRRKQKTKKGTVAVPRRDAVGGGEMESAAGRGGAKGLQSRRGISKKKQTGKKQVPKKN